MNSVQHFYYLPREHLSSNTLDDGDDVTSVERLLLIVDLLLFHKK